MPYSGADSLEENSVNETFILAITVLPFWLAIAVIVLGLTPSIVIAARAPQVKTDRVLILTAALGFLAAGYASLNAASPLLIG